MNVHSPVDVSPTRVRLTVADVMLLDGRGAFDGYGKIELIDGELLYVNAQFRRHMVVKSELAYRLRRALETLGSSLFVGIERSVALSANDLPQPDILFTAEPAGDGPVPGDSVALLVEIADTALSFDLGRKASSYAKAGVPEYWVVDINAERIHVLSGPFGGGYQQHREIAFGVPITADTMPSLTIATTGL